MVSLRELKLKGRKKCDCGHMFNANDIASLVKNDDYVFYGGRVEFYSETECPDCHAKAIILLEAYDNSYRVIDIGEIAENIEEIEEAGREESRRDSKQNVYV